MCPFPESNTFEGIVCNTLMRGRKLCSFICVTLIYLAGMLSKVISSLRSNEASPLYLAYDDSLLFRKAKS